MKLGEVSGQGALQLGELTLALVLSALIGLEREIRQKSAGLRTYSLVGLASALVIIVSKYGFSDVLASGRVVLDPSRVAAQVVTGIGFIGGGLIFVRRDSVRGLTTAAGMWLTAAIGMASGAGLPLLAVAATVGHFIVVFLFPLILRRLSPQRSNGQELQVLYRLEPLVIESVLRVCAEQGFQVNAIKAVASPEHPDLFSLKLDGELTRPLASLLSALSTVKGVVTIETGETEDQ